MQNAKLWKRLDVILTERSEWNVSQNAEGRVQNYPCYSGTERKFSTFLDKTMRL